MSRLEPEFRVNSRTLNEHKGKTVRLTAKVVKIVGDIATVEACDGGEDMHIEDKFVEIIGSVRDDHTVRALTSINLGPNLDMKAVNAVVEYSHSSKGQGVLA